MVYWGQRFLRCVGLPATPLSSNMWRWLTEEIHIKDARMKRGAAYERTPYAQIKRMDLLFR